MTKTIAYYRGRPVAALRTDLFNPETGTLGAVLDNGELIEVTTGDLAASAGEYVEGEPVLYDGAEATVLRHGPDLDWRGRQRGQRMVVEITTAAGRRLKVRPREVSRP